MMLHRRLVPLSLRQNKCLLIVIAVCGLLVLTVIHLRQYSIVNFVYHTESETKPQASTDQLESKDGTADQRVPGSTERKNAIKNTCTKVFIKRKLIPEHANEKQSQQISGSAHVYLSGEPANQDVLHPVSNGTQLFICSCNQDVFLT